MLATATRVIQPPRSSSVFHQMIFAAALAAGLSLGARPALPQSAPQAAIDELRLKVHESPSDPLAYYHLAVALYHSEAHNGLGVIFDQQGKLQEALQEFREAVKTDPDDAEARYNLGLALVRISKDYQQARTELEQAVRLNPKMGKAHYQLGRVYENLGEPAQARREFEQAIALNAEDSKAYFALANLSRKQGDRAAAKAYLAQFNQLKQREMNRDLATREYRSGTLLAQRKEWDRAIEQFRKALELNPGLNVARFNMAGALPEKDDLESAARELRQVVQSSPNGPKHGMNWE
jgi:Flp pilus assembly protein TadD